MIVSSKIFVMTSSSFLECTPADKSEILIFSTDFLKTPNIKFHEIRPVGAELFHVNGQTDMIVFYCNSANGPKTYMF